MSIKIMGSATQALRADLDSSFFWLLHFLPAPKSLIFFVFQAYKSRGPSGGQGTAYFILPISLPKLLTKILTDHLLVLLRIKIYKNDYLVLFCKPNNDYRYSGSAKILIF